MPEGLRLPDIIITRRTRTISMSGRIEDEVRTGTVKFFCRSRGHGFIDDDESQGGIPVFMHISDIEGEYIPRKNDRVRYRICPMPPRFDRAQAVHIEIIDLNPDGHHKWTEKETPEEMLEDREAIKEEAKVNELLIRHRTSSVSYSSDNGGGTTP
jgi:cold shock CspA family protein